MPTDCARAAPLRVISARNARTKAEEPGMGRKRGREDLVFAGRKVAVISTAIVSLCMSSKQPRGPVALALALLLAGTLRPHVVGAQSLPGVDLGGVMEVGGEA